MNGQRLDAELVRRKMARSRSRAAGLIAAGRVAVAGQIARQPAARVSCGAAITLHGDHGDHGDPPRAIAAGPQRPSTAAPVDRSARRPQ